MKTWEAGLLSHPKASWSRKHTMCFKVPPTHTNPPTHGFPGRRGTPATWAPKLTVLGAFLSSVEGPAILAREHAVDAVQAPHELFYVAVCPFYLQIARPVTGLCAWNTTAVLCLVGNLRLASLSLTRQKPPRQCTQTCAHTNTFKNWLAVFANSAVAQSLLDVIECVVPINVLDQDQGKSRFIQEEDARANFQGLSCFT
jgi:hypothetical protein